MKFRYPKAGMAALMLLTSVMVNPTFAQDDGSGTIPEGD